MPPVRLERPGAPGRPLARPPANRDRPASLPGPPRYRVEPGRSSAASTRRSTGEKRIPDAPGFVHFLLVSTPTSQVVHREQSRGQRGPVRSGVEGRIERPETVIEEDLLSLLRAKIIEKGLGQLAVTMPLDRGVDDGRGSLDQEQWPAGSRKEALALRACPEAGARSRR